MDITALALAKKYTDKSILGVDGVLKGEKGDPGPQGIPGPKGEKGEPGEGGVGQAIEVTREIFNDYLHNLANGDYAHAEGNATIAQGYASHAQGQRTQAGTGYIKISSCSVIGYDNNSNTSTLTATLADNRDAMTSLEGENFYAYVVDVADDQVFAITGLLIEAQQKSYTIKINGNPSPIVNNRMPLVLYLGTNKDYGGIMTNNVSFATGRETKALGEASASFGNKSQSIGANSIASGNYTMAFAANSIALGKYNSYTDHAFVIGNGTTDSSCSNALTVDWLGNINASGKLTSSGEDYAEYFEWLDGNPDAEDRIGYLVSLNGEKIKLAEENDEIFGAVSGTACVLGDSALWEWKYKYQTDDFGRVIYDMVEEFIEVPVEVQDEDGNTTIIMQQKSTGFFPHRRLNPDYDVNKPYISREARPEWDTVGLIGKLHIRDDGTCISGGYVKVGTQPGVATLSQEKTNVRMMKRVNDNIILAFIK